MKRIINIIFHIIEAFTTVMLVYTVGGLGQKRMKDEGLESSLRNSIKAGEELAYDAVEGWK